jgi:hypothetical protein
MRIFFFAFLVQPVAYIRLIYRRNKVITLTSWGEMNSLDIKNGCRAFGLPRT